MSNDFPIGGPREAVYRALRQRGFAMCGFGDKHWQRVDGLGVHIYGSGSKLLVRHNTNQVADGPMGEMLALIDRDYPMEVARA